MALGGAQAGDMLSDTVARRVLGSLYYSLYAGNQWETIIGSVNCEPEFVCLGGGLL